MFVLELFDIACVSIISYRLHTHMHTCACTHASCVCTVYVTLKAINVDCTNGEPK